MCKITHRILVRIDEEKLFDNITKVCMFLIIYQWHSNN